MISTAYRPYSCLCPAMKALLLQLIREEYQPLLHLPANLPEEAWACVVTKVNPVFFCLNDGIPLIQIGEASRRRLLLRLKKELGSPQ